VSMLNQAKGLHCPKPEGRLCLSVRARTMGRTAPSGRSSKPTRTSSPNSWRPRG
jgi:hypothetical protein